MVNLVFMFLNLLPILPLDGGRIVASLLPHARRVALREARALGHAAPARAALVDQRAQLRARARCIGASDALIRAIVF